MIGLTGGVLGLLLTGVGVASVSWVLPKDIASLARVDVPLLALTLLVSWSPLPWQACIPPSVPRACSLPGN